MHYLSVSDLLWVDGFKEVFSKDDKEGIETILWTNGLDINKEYEAEVVTHRNLRKQIVTCLRYVGKERTDKEFLATGAASLDAHIEASGCKFMKDELRSLNPRDVKDYSDDYACNCDIPESFDDDCV